MFEAMGIERVHVVVLLVTFGIFGVGFLLEARTRWTYTLSRSLERRFPRLFPSELTTPMEGLARSHPYGRGSSTSS